MSLEFNPYNDDFGNRQELKVNKDFISGKIKILIPSVFLCQKALIIDFIKEASCKDMTSFLKKWYRENNKYTKLENEEIERENPLNLNVKYTAVLNGRGLKRKNLSSTPYIPKTCLPDGAVNWVSEAESFVEYYNLDKNSCYNFIRVTFPLEHEEEIQSLSVLLEPYPIHLPGRKIVTEKSEETFKIKNPFTGIEHQIKICELSKEKSDTPSAENLVYPDNYIRLSYQITPDLNKDEFYLKDQCEHDSPKDLQGKTLGGAFGLIVFNKQHESNNCYSAISSFHFDKINKVEWQTFFVKKIDEDMEICLM